MSSNPKLRQAVQLALVSSALAATAYTPLAISQESLEEIVITGSRIRRVDQETASPVLIVDRGAIEASGVTTMGSLMQRIPSISGAATNPAVNNGGGDGASTIELRGLGAERTLVLLNGRRVLGGSAVDVNVFPVNLIERVDVLKEGAGAIYGTDAVGGVVNFVTRKDLDGFELNYDYGVSSESDGRRDAVGLAWGTQGERGRVIIGANYNKQKEISAGDRKFARNALYLYGGTVSAGGSSRAPNGRIRFNAGDPLIDQFGCSSVTKIEGAPGTSLADYRCFITSGDNADFYNYQPLNLVMTPQERASIFTSGNYQVTDSVEAYAEWLHNYTTSGFQIAELPFDARSDNVVIPANNYYNPFGIAFGGIDGANPNAQWRMKGLGTRSNKVTTTSDQITVGVKGRIMDSSWEWDLSGNYAGIGQNTTTGGYLLSSKLQTAFGPSFFDAASNSVVCGTPGNIISGCIPINIFDINSASQADALRTIAASYNQSQTTTVKGAELGFTGNLFDMPAGAAQVAIGGGYTEYALAFDTDTLTEAQPPDFLTCGLSQETCSSDTRGSYDVTLLYAEVFLPLLADAPLAKALNLTLGTSYADYSTFGSTTNSSVKLEWRPIADLLVRASWSEVFRSPTINDLYGGALANAPTFNDPCVGLTAADVTANPNLALACVNVATDGSFSQDNSQVTGLVSGTPDLKPETGDVLTAGFVYQPDFFSGFSVSFDWWQYKLNDAILSYDNLGLDVNTAAEVCVATGDPAFCGLINRAQDGAVIVIGQPTVNLGKIETSGYDVGLKYALRDTAAGSFEFTLDTTYIDTFDSTVCSECGTDKIAGTFDRQYGNYAKWRALAGIGWAFEPFTALLSARYIDGGVIHDPDGAPGIQPDLKFPSRTYLDLTVGYTFRKNLTINLGVDNLTNEDPPILYQNNVLNANTDVSTYDTVGTYYRASLKYKF
jgi:outer membrane receptor protein involved in Fe transport